VSVDHRPDRGDKRFAAPVGFVDADAGSLGAGQLGAVGRRPQPQHTKLEDQELELQVQAVVLGLLMFQDGPGLIQGGICVVVAALPDGELGQTGQRPGSLGRRRVQPPGRLEVVTGGLEVTPAHLELALDAVQHEGSGRLSLQGLGEDPVALLPVPEVEQDAGQVVGQEAPHPLLQPELAGDRQTASGHGQRVSRPAFHS